MLTIISLETFFIVVAIILGALLFKRLTRSKKVDTFVKDLVQPDVVSEYDRTVELAKKRVQEDQEKIDALKKSREEIVSKIKID